MLPAETVAAIRDQRPVEDLPEFARRDVALGVHEARVPTALDSWGIERPSVLDPAYIYLPRNENRFLFFVEPSARWRGPWY